MKKVNLTLVVCILLLSNNIFSQCNPPPKADFSVNGGSFHGCISDSFHFQNTSQNATIYYWKFGDGLTSWKQSPSHLYDPLGYKTITYSVQLIVQYNTCKDSVTKNINAFEAISGFSTIGSGKTISYNASDNANYNSYSWDFGDGTTSNQKSGTKLYTDTLSSHTICLEVTINNPFPLPCKSKTCKTIATLSNNKIDFINQFNIYPNPNSGKFELNVSNIGNNEIIEILNTSGQIVFEKKISEINENYNLDLAQGIYFVKLRDYLGYTITKRMIILIN